MIACIRLSDGTVARGEVITDDEYKEALMEEIEQLKKQLSISQQVSAIVKILRD